MKKLILIAATCGLFAGCNSLVAGSALKGLGNAMQCIGSQGDDCPTAQYAPIPPMPRPPPTVPGMPSPPAPPPPGTPGGILCPACVPPPRMG